MALRKGHVGGTSRNPLSSEMSLHPTYRHPSCFTRSRFESSFETRLYRPWTGLGLGVVWSFTLDTACGSLRVQLSGGPAMCPATRKSFFISSLSPSVTSPVDLASPNISHIICYLSAPFQAPSSLTGSFITASLLLQILPVAIQRPHIP